MKTFIDLLEAKIDDITIELLDGGHDAEEVMALCDEKDDLVQQIVDAKARMVAERARNKRRMLRLAMINRDVSLATIREFNDIERQTWKQERADHQQIEAAILRAERAADKS